MAYPIPEAIPVSTQIRMSTSVATDALEELSKFIFADKYARYNEKYQRRETWTEAVERVRNMHLKRFFYLPHQDVQQITDAFELVKQKVVVPSMRSMQFGGVAIEAHNERIFNCAVRHIDSVRSFAEIFYLLLCGCGVGIGLSKKFLSRLPKLVKPHDLIIGSNTVYVIADTIEGWADSIEILLLSYFEGNNLSGQFIEFDYSQIRPEDSPLKTSGGKAPGSEGLRRAHERIRNVMFAVMKRGTFKTIDALDVCCHAADAVLSGGVRRSALSGVFQKEDADLVHAKVGNWMDTNPQRARANLSMLLLREETTEQDVLDVVHHTRQWGEPGFVFADHPDTLFNPCFEISFIPVTEDGRCGVQFCNLTSINGSKIGSSAEWLDAVEAATIIGTLQASYTYFPYLGDVAARLTCSEALLGVSMTGMMDNPHLLLNEDIQRVGAKFAVETNALWAEKIGINPAARVTCVKPEGTGTLALGSVSNGIHPAHAHRMFKRVQVNRNDPIYQAFKDVNPTLCETSVWSASGTDDVITFPIELPETTMVKKNLTALQHLDIIRRTQNAWVRNGEGANNVKPLSHNVSCTVVVKDTEWDAVARYLHANMGSFSAVSLLADTGDKDYPQAPNEAVSTMDDLLRFKHFQRILSPVDYSQVREHEDVTAPMQQLSCAGGFCEIGT